MLLLFFILFVLQHQIECNSAFRYPQDNKAILNRRKNELRVKNDDYGDTATGAKSNAKEQGLSIEGKVAHAQSAADAFRKNIHFNDESPEAKPPAHHRSFNDPSRATHAPLSPVFSSRLKLGKHKHVHEPVMLLSATPLAPTLPQAEETISRLLRTRRPTNLELELRKRKARLYSEMGGPQMRVEPGAEPPPPVLAYVSSEEKDHELVLEVPDANMLDMAKAVGGHLPSMRNQNRLCSRHVLIPEGPKYDSKGAVYLAAFSAKTPKRSVGVSPDYEVTNKPRLLLPKCCNCCKKSVLGCE